MTSRFEALVRQWQQIHEAPAPSPQVRVNVAAPLNGESTGEAELGDRWISRGTYFKPDMIEAIRTYSYKERCETRQVIDLALRQFFGGMANE